MITFGGFFRNGRSDAIPARSFSKSFARASALLKRFEPQKHPALLLQNLHEEEGDCDKQDEIDGRDRKR